MPIAREWTKAADETIHEMRGAGETWAAIGLRLGLSRNTVIERGRRINAAAGKIEKPASEEEPIGPNRDLARGPLPPGSPLTWGAICTEPYPFPTFNKED